MSEEEYEAIQPETHTTPQQQQAPLEERELEHQIIARDFMDVLGDMENASQASVLEYLRKFCFYDHAIYTGEDNPMKVQYMLGMRNVYLEIRRLIEPPKE